MIAIDTCTPKIGSAANSAGRASARSLRVAASHSSIARVTCCWSSSPSSSIASARRRAPGAAMAASSASG